MTIAERLTELSIVLPPAPQPVGSYLPCIRAGKLLFTSGQLPMKDGQVSCTGAVGSKVDVATGAEAARQCVLNALAIIQAELGSLDRVERIVRLTCFVNSAPGFTQQPKVANGASDLLAAILGEKGKHSRVAIGAAELPLDASVELDLIVQVED